MLCHVKLHVVVQGIAIHESLKYFLYNEVHSNFDKKLSELSNDTHIKIRVTVTVLKLR